jgi:predicted membrane chloride channel (bestrophin family)
MNMVSSRYPTNPTVDQARAALMGELENPTEWVTDEFGLSTKDAAKLVNAFEVAVKAKLRAQVAADFTDALLKSTDGDDVHDDFEIPAGEIRRILAELVEGGAR